MGESDESFEKYESGVWNDALRGSISSINATAKSATKSPKPHRCTWSQDQECQEERERLCQGGRVDRSLQQWGLDSEAQMIVSRG